MSTEPRRDSGWIVGYTEAIHFDGLSATRGSVTDPRFRCATSARRPLHGQVRESIRKHWPTSGPRPDSDEPPRVGGQHGSAWDSDTPCWGLPCFTRLKLLSHLLGSVRIQQLRTAASDLQRGWGELKRHRATRCKVAPQSSQLARRP